jgi:type IV pilus assembly protein PilC
MTPLQHGTSEPRRKLAAGESARGREPGRLGGRALSPATDRNAAPAHAESPPELFPRRVTRKEIVYLTDQLAVMVDTGITLANALGSINEQIDNPTLAGILADLKQRVESGEDFSTALARYPKIFDETYVQLVRASEVSGALGEMLQRICDQGRRDLEARGKVRAAMAYPAVMMLASIAASVFLLVYIFPKFTPLFAGRGIALPTPTRVMMAISDSLITYWYLAVTLPVALAGGVAWFSKTAWGREVTDHAKLTLPVLGAMFGRAALSRSLRTLATMITSGVPMLEAIRLTGQVAGNQVYKHAWNEVAEAVTCGQQIHEVLRRRPQFPPSLVQMIAAGEQTGRLGGVLHRVSEFYDRELDAAIKAATSVIEPIMVCFMGVVVGSIAMALLLPIFTLSRSMH